MCFGNFGGQVWYDFILVVDFNDVLCVWVGGVGISVFVDNGVNWIGLGGIYVDYYVIVYYFGDFDQILFGNDGGVYKFINGLVVMFIFVDKNNIYNVIQFYVMVIYLDVGFNYMLGGM